MPPKKSRKKKEQSEMVDEVTSTVEVTPPPVVEAPPVETVPVVEVVTPPPPVPVVPAVVPVMKKIRNRTSLRRGIKLADGVTVFLSPRGKNGDTYEVDSSLIGEGIIKCLDMYLIEMV